MTEYALHQSVETALREKHPNSAARVEQFLHTQGHRYLIGQNAESLAALEWLPFHGVIDDRAAPNSTWHKLPLVHMAAVPSDAWVLNCSSSIAPVNVLNALTAAGLNQHLNLCELLQHPSTPGTLRPSFLTEQTRDYTQHWKDWEHLYQRLADEESQRTLEDVLRYRLTANPQYMQHHQVRFRDQYFEDFLHLHQEVFVDAGGFDGDTTEEFCQRDPHYRKVFLIEPAATNMAAAKQRLAKHRDIAFIEQGLSDQAATLSFDPELGSASTVQAQGKHSIQVNTLDTLVQEPVTFIKMDLEGWELHALAGCKQHIQHHRPKLAISVYHQASHFREVLHTVLNMVPDYTVRLRHYTQGWSETVMFFTCE